MKARFAVDWDDTLVEDNYPDQGPWLPGAVDALYALERLGTVVIFSCRVSPYEHPAAGNPENDVLRREGAVLTEINRMKTMLGEVGLGHIEVWTRPYKPPATCYIDNRAVRFTGNWDETLEHVLDALAPITERPAAWYGDKGPEWTVQAEAWDPSWLKADYVEGHSVKELEEMSQDEYYRLLNVEAEPFEITPDSRKVIDQLMAGGEVSEFLTKPYPFTEWDLTDKLIPDRHPNSARFHELLGLAGEMHDRKQEDYGKGDDPFANVRSSTEWGLPGWVGAMVRLNDKVRRLQSLRTKGSLANESALDSFLDIAVYALIAHVLYEQEMGAAE